MKCISMALIAVILVGCGATEATATDVASVSSAPCDPGAIIVSLVEAKLTPSELDKYADCAIPDDPALYARVWCCPAVD